MSRIIIIYRRSILLAALLLVGIFMWGIESIYAQSVYKLKMFEPGFQDKVIILDPGHGGADPGATAGGVMEKDINLAICEKISAELNKKGILNFLTRGQSGGLNPDKAMNRAERRANLNKRKAFGLEKKGNVFISVHTNSVTDTQVSGPMIFYHKSGAYNKLLADAIAGQMEKQLNQKVPVREDKYLVIYQNPIPSILIEVGFITNYQDRMMLTNAKNQETIAKSIVSGIEEYANHLGKVD